MPSTGLNASSSLAAARRGIRPSASAAPGAMNLYNKLRSNFPRYGSSSSGSKDNSKNPDSTTSGDNSNSGQSGQSSGQSQQSSSTGLPPPSTTFAHDQSRNLRNMSEAEIRDYLQENHERLFQNNRKWADDHRCKNPEFFAQLSAGQHPDYLWIGCADSRIPAEQIVGLEPGEAFIHRNIANLVCNTDLNVMGVINYAVRHLGVKHIIVCGHYGCGGVKAAMTPKDLGLLNPWLRNIRDVYRLHEKESDAIEDDTERYNRLVELNVIEQCRNVIKTADVQQHYAENKFPIVHGWVFGFHDGLVKDLKIDFEAMLEDIQKIYNLTN